VDRQRGPGTRIRRRSSAKRIAALPLAAADETSRGWQRPRSGSDPVLTTGSSHRESPRRSDRRARIESRNTSRAGRRGCDLRALPELRIHPRTHSTRGSPWMGSLRVESAREENARGEPLSRALVAFDRRRRFCEILPSVATPGDPNSSPSERLRLQLEAEPTSSGAISRCHSIPMGTRNPIRRRNVTTTASRRQSSISVSMRAR
jgi:hypothetical protein